MKSATCKVLNYFPTLNYRLNDCLNPDKAQQSLNDLNETHQVFLRLVWFFEHPEDQEFSVHHLYKGLSSNWIQFALEVLTEYFQKDTYLFSDAPIQSLQIEENNFTRHLLTMKEVSSMLIENGFNYYPQKISVYLSRKKFIEPDLIIGGTKYWYKKQFIPT